MRISRYDFKGAKDYFGVLGYGVMDCIYFLHVCHLVEIQDHGLKILKILKKLIELILLNTQQKSVQINNIDYSNYMHEKQSIKGAIVL